MLQNEEQFRRRLIFQVRSRRNVYTPISIFRNSPQFLLQAFGYFFLSAKDTVTNDQQNDRIFLGTGRRSYQQQLTGLKGACRRRPR